MRMDKYDIVSLLYDLVQMCKLSSFRCFACRCCCPASVSLPYDYNDLDNNVEILLDTHHTTQYSELTPNMRPTQSLLRPNTNYTVSNIWDSIATLFHKPSVQLHDSNTSRKPSSNINFDQDGNNAKIYTALIKLEDALSYNNEELSLINQKITQITTSSDNTIHSKSHSSKSKKSNTNTSFTVSTEGDRLLDDESSDRYVTPTESSSPSKASL